MAEAHRTLLLEVLAPIALLLVLSNAVIGSGPVVRFLDERRPSRGQSLVGSAEGQVLHMEAARNRHAGVPRVVVVGSSSVANGIDETLMRARLASAGLNYEVLSYGLTGMEAYELPLLRHYLLDDESIALVVYAYNYYSFTDDPYDLALSVRLDAAEYFRTCGLRDLRLKDLDPLASGAMGQVLFIARYRRLLNYTVRACLAGTLARRTYPYDFVPGRPRPTTTARRDSAPDAEEPKPTLQESVYGQEHDLWEGVAAHYRLFMSPRMPLRLLRPAVESALSRLHTRGYRGLSRFLYLAQECRTAVVVTPAPEPDFAEFDYMGGLPVGRIDRRVQEIAAGYGVTFLPRSGVAGIEARDEHFRDPIHLYDTGRDAYSAYLAERLASLLPALRELRG